MVHGYDKLTWWVNDEPNFEVLLNSAQYKLYIYIYIYIYLFIYLFIKYPVSVQGQ